MRYHDIGDYLTREQKLDAIETFGSIDSVPWQAITPNESGDWINQRDETFGTFPPLGGKRDTAADSLFRHLLAGSCYQPGRLGIQL